MYCINEHFLQGCNFDVAYQNPCRADEDVRATGDRSAKLEAAPADYNDTTHFDSTNDLNFSDEQQMKLRTIASRAGLLNILVENTLLNKGAARAIGPLINGATSSTSSAPSSPDNDGQSQGKIVVYLLMAMIVLTVLVTVAMIFVIINWTQVKMSRNSNQEGSAEERSAERTRTPGRQYLSNQQHHLRGHQHHNSRHTSRSSAINMDRDIVKPLGSASVIKTSRRQGSINNSAL